MHDKIFDPSKRKKLNNPERLEWLNPQEIWKFMNIPAPETIVDIGAGTGFITRAFAAHLTETKIYAFDIERLMVKEMETLLSDNPNFMPRLITNGHIELPDASVDVTWMINLYHELPQPIEMLQEIRRVLKPGGKILIIDWAKNKDSVFTGPPLEHRVDEITIKDHLSSAKFTYIKSSSQFQFHLAVLAEKRPKAELIKIRI